jgi:hypothetical protein
MTEAEIHIRMEELRVILAKRAIMGAPADDERSEMEDLHRQLGELNG